MKILFVVILILLIILYFKSKRLQKQTCVPNRAPKKRQMIREKLPIEKITVNKENIKNYAELFKEVWKPVGNLKPECPYCAYKFKKMPQSKGKCHSCKETFYSRKIPQKNQRSLLREEDLPILKKQFNAITYITIHTNKNSPEYQEAYKELMNKFGAKPREYDVLWRLFNVRIIQTTLEGNFGLLTLAYMEAADILRKETDFFNSLTYFFYVCYLDINGAYNGMEQTDMYMYRGDPIAYQKKNSIISAHIITNIKKLTVLAALTIDEQEEIFYYSMNQYNSFPYPIYSYTESWEQTKKALEEDFGGDNYRKILDEIQI